MIDISDRSQPLDRLGPVIRALSANPLFEKAEPVALRKLAQRARWETFATTELVYRKGDPAHSIAVVASGILRVSAVSEDGRQTVFGLMEPGAIVGEVALFCAGGRSADVSAMVDSKLVTLSRSSFIAFLGENPHAMAELLKGMAERIRHLSDHLVEARFATLPERLHRTLVALSRLDRKRVIRISQASLGEMALASREIVNRQLNQWRAMRLIQMKRKEITLSDAFVSMTFK